MNYFAGFYCSPEERAQYTDDKILIRLVAVAIFVTLIFIILKKVKRTWLRVTLIMLAAIFCLIGWMYVEFSRVGFC